MDGSTACQDYPDETRDWISEQQVHVLRVQNHCYEALPLRMVEPMVAAISGVWQSSAAFCGLLSVSGPMGKNQNVNIHPECQKIS